MHDVKNILYSNCLLVHCLFAMWIRHQKTITFCVHVKLHSSLQLQVTCFSTRSTRDKSCNPWEKCICSWLQAGSTVCIAPACHKWSNIVGFLLSTCVMDFTHILSCARQTCRDHNGLLGGFWVSHKSIAGLQIRFSSLFLFLLSEVLAKR